ncbi:MAG: beta-Ala-His dipeptidase [Spirochaetales bacterium]|nr:beta-Ala-His dipeptidase [Spirochaetales bacterium]
MQLSDLEPKDVWERFLELCAVPRPSHHEQAVSALLADRARARGFDVRVDEALNLVIRKSASPGRENAPGIILQAHLDMVPQAASDSGHNFLADPIRPRVDPKDPAWVIATGTTLGADDGMGVAMALAVLEDESLEHGPLECLFTTNEEDGMDGARAVLPGTLQGRILLNLDGEDDTEFTIGCAGSIRTTATLSRAASSVPDATLWVEATTAGLLGGHSGVDIDKGRANATLTLARLLKSTGVPLYLRSLEGGTAANAIPREARALVGVEPGRFDDLAKAFKAAAATIHHELGARDPGFSATLTRLDEGSVAGGNALDAVASVSLLDTLISLPNGLIQMEPDMPGHIRTSLNLGTLRAGVTDGVFEASTLVMVRSSSDAEKERLAVTVEKTLQTAQNAGWAVSQSRLSETPAWTPNTDSELLKTALTVYHELTGEEPKVVSTHGGLETGLFRPVFPHWDMLSLGPTIRYPHSPDERVEIASVARSYRFVRELVSRLSGF